MCVVTSQPPDKIENRLENCFRFLVCLKLLFLITCFIAHFMLCSSYCPKYRWSNPLRNFTATFTISGGTTGSRYCGHICAGERPCIELTASAVTQQSLYT